ncbi:MAG: thioredoxin protein [Bacteroidetes bacterium]|nr:thioredoxin protein [Bacteroidota bacterium]
MRYALLEKDHDVLDHVHLTLQQMAYGGIYDQLRGGFARYSTDVIWKVPHFEKMLYDNAQLVSLYCEAYQHSKNELYKEVVLETLNFVKEEWYNEKGFFYSAFDADSEGEEGKYYVWTKDELKDALGENFELFADYYQLNEIGYWEHDNYILMRNENLAEISVKFNLSKEKINEKISACKETLKKIADKRVKPGLDDKTRTSWNAMTCTGFAKAYLVFRNDDYKTIALQSAEFILSELSQENGKLFRTYKEGRKKINGFLDDYAFVIEALIQVYLITQNENYLQKANDLAGLVLKEFNNPDSPFLYYTDESSSNLISRSTEVSDNVIPSSNSQMALNLFYLGTYFGNDEYTQRSIEMLNLTGDEIRHYGAGYSNWGCLALHLNYPFREIAIVGNNVNEKLLEAHKHGFTNAILVPGRNKSDLPVLKNRFIENETWIYVCENKTCKLPVKTIEEAMTQFE